MTKDNNDSYIIDGNDTLKEIITLYNGNDDDPEAKSNGSDKHSVYAIVSSAEPGQIVIFNLENNRSSTFSPSTGVDIINSHTATTATRDDGSTPNVYFTNNLGTYESVMVIANALITEFASKSFVFSPSSSPLTVKRSDDDIPYPAANGSDKHSVYASAPGAAGGKVKFSLPQNKSATFAPSSQVSIDDPFTAYTNVNANGYTPNVYFVCGYPDGETVDITASIDGNSDSTSFNFISSPSQGKHQYTWINNPTEGQQLGRGMNRPTNGSVNAQGVAKPNSTVHAYLINDPSSPQDPLHTPVCSTQADDQGNWSLIVGFVTSYPPSNQRTLIVTGDDGYSDVKRVYASCTKE